jgi:large subunit ribosomal protein L29
MKAKEKIKNLRENTVSGLRTRGSELRRERVLMRLQNATGQLENPARFGAVGREIAQIETVLGERRLQAQAKA